MLNWLKMCNLWNQLAGMRNMQPLRNSSFCSTHCTYIIHNWLKVPQNAEEQITTASKQMQMAQTAYIQLRYFQ